MSIALDAQCIVCHIRRHVATALSLGDGDTATRFAKELMKLYIAAPDDVSMTALGPQVDALYRRFYDVGEDRFAKEKADSNRFVMDRLDTIRHRAESAADPVLAGLKLAILGNYIDFSALQGQVSFDTLDRMLGKALEAELDMAVYGDFCNELAAGTKLLYLTDNAGEIGFDRIFAEQLQRAYPHLEITFCVRGGNAQNDATRADADAVGIPFRIIDSGCAIAGTEISLLGPEAKQVMDAADVIIAKGQGNAETLLDCGYNIYYAFLVKCVRFEQRYGKPKFTPMFVKERQSSCKEGR